MGEALATVGPRTALQWVARTLRRVFIRGKARGLVNNGDIKLLYKQQDLADALGLSLVHTNKTLGQLKSEQMAHWTDGMLRIPDLERLAEVALIEEPLKRPII